MVLNPCRHHHHHNQGKTFFQIKSFETSEAILARLVMQKDAVPVAVVSGGMLHLPLAQTHLTCSVPISVRLLAQVAHTVRWQKE